MLELKLCLDTSQVEDREIQLDKGKNRLMINPSTGTLTGVVDSSYNLPSSGYIDIIGVDGKKVKCAINSTIIKNNGYLKIDKKYPIRMGRFNSTDERCDLEDKEIFYYIYIDGVFYYVDKSDSSYNIKDSAITGETYYSSEYELGYFTIPTKYHIDNDHIEIDGQSYYVDVQYGNGSPQSAYLVSESGAGDNDMEISGDSFCYTQATKYLTKFTISIYSNHSINIESASCCGDEYFFEYKDNGAYSGGTNAYYEEYYEENNDGKPTYKSYRTSISGIADEDIPKIHNSLGYDISTIDSVTVKGKSFQLQHQYINSNGSDKVFLELNDGVKVGDTILCTRYEPNKVFCNTKQSGDDKYIVHNGIRYFVSTEKHKYVVIDNVEYLLFKDYNRSGKASANYEGIILDFEEVYNEVGTTVTRKIVGTNAKPSYNVVSYEYVDVNGVEYDVVKVDDSLFESNATPIVTDEYTPFGYIEGVYINEDTQYYLTVDDVLGSSMFVCSPVVKVGIKSGLNIYNEKANICSDIVNDFENFTVTPIENTFGIFGWNPQKGFEGDMKKEDIKSSIVFDNPYELLKIVTPSDYFKIPLNLVNQAQPRADQEEIVKKDFFEYQRNKAINEIVDMEKDVYYPVVPIYSTTQGQTSEVKLDEQGRRMFEPIHEIRFNLHFRTRDLSNWKVIEDNESTMYNEDLKDWCNWFITDYEPYKTLLNDSSNHNRLLRTSDLLGLLDFTNNDVLRQKNNLQKSFLRLSFYDTIDPKTQSLLATSTIWVDEGNLSAKSIKNKKTRKKSFFRVYKTNEDYKKEDNISNSCSVFSEKYTKDVNYKKFNEPSKKHDVTLDEEDRLSCQFIVKSKYEDEESAEGFYLHIFKEYSSNMHPKKVYMKVDFNHAGIGRSIPFILPMKWTYGDKKHKKDLIPFAPLSFNSGNSGQNTSLVDFQNNKTDIEILKQGIPLSSVYEQSYIPINVIYDDKENKYVYYPDKVYNNDTDLSDGVMEWNLFELKVMDKSQASLIKGTSLSITYNGKTYVWDTSSNGEKKFTINVHRTDFAFYVECVQDGNNLYLTPGNTIGGNQVTIKEVDTKNHYEKKSLVTKGHNGKSLVHFILDEPSLSGETKPNRTITISLGGITAEIGMHIDQMEVLDGGGSYGHEVDWNYTASNADLLNIVKEKIGLGSKKGDDAENNAISNVKYYYTYEYDVIETEDNPRDAETYIDAVMFGSKHFNWSGTYIDNDGNTVPTKRKKESYTDDIFQVPNSPENFGQYGCQTEQTITFVIKYKEGTGIKNRTYTITRKPYPKQ